MISSDDVGLETWGNPNLWFVVVKVGPEGDIALPFAEDEVQWVFETSGSKIGTVVLYGLDEGEIDGVWSIAGGKYVVDGGV